MQLEIDIKNQWIPAPDQAKDSMIMDLALTYNLTSQQLNSINMCRIYLQVLALSDITAADWEWILPSVLIRIRDTQRTSQHPMPPTIFRVSVGFFSPICMSTQEAVPASGPLECATPATMGIVSA